jgi:hypothetical protein
MQVSTTATWQREVIQFSNIHVPHTLFFCYLRSGNFHTNVSCHIYNIIMSYDNCFYTQLVDPITEHELNEYIMVTKMTFNQNDIVSD